MNKSIEKGLKDCKEGKISKINLEELEKEIFKKRQWYNHCYWWIKHGIWQRLSETPLIIKSFFQRGIRGWADSDTWGLDFYLSKIIYEGLVYLKKHKQGFPITISPTVVNDPNKDIDYDLNEKNWNLIMDKVIYAFKLSNDIGNGDREFYLPKLDNKNKRKLKYLTIDEDRKMKKGFKLFIEYYHSFWD